MPGSARTGANNGRRWAADSTTPDILQRYAAAFAEDHRRAAADVYTDDVVLRIPGRHPFAGEFHGRGAVVATLDAIAGATDGTLGAREVRGAAFTPTTAMVHVVMAATVAAAGPSGSGSSCIGSPTNESRRSPSSTTTYARWSTSSAEAGNQAGRVGSPRRLESSDQPPHIRRAVAGPAGRHGRGSVRRIRWPDRRAG
jgi:hypothetical protein